MLKDERFLLGDLEFIWDAAKNQANAKTHGIAFEESATTWLDPNSVEAFDHEHSIGEDRWIRIGISLRGAVLVTWSTVRFQGTREMIRIIGSRRANANERRKYEEEQGRTA